MSEVPGLKAVHAIITPNCLVVQGGALLAFDEAIERLRRTYTETIEARERNGAPSANYHLVLTVEASDDA
ncbi:MAG: hypothetical protein ACOC9T_02050 [Myxococcota bacterium]